MKVEATDNQSLASGKISNSKSLHQIKQESGFSLHKSMLSRKMTNLWEKGEGKKGNLSYLKMKAAVNMSHPRIAIDGAP